MKVFLYNTLTLALSLSGKYKLSFPRLFFTLCYFGFSRKLIPSLRKKSFLVCGYYKTHKVCYSLTAPMDIGALVEVYVLKEYEWAIGHEPKVILDLGAHFGDTAVFYSACYPQAKIISAEPEPKSFMRLELNARGVDNIVPVQVAVGGSNGVIKLHVSKSSLGHSVIERDYLVNVVEVAQVTISQLLTNQNLKRVDLIKFDIEGAEFLMLRGTNPADYADYYIGELHFDLDKTASIEEVIEIFRDFDVELEQLDIKSRYILKAKIKNK